MIDLANREETFVWGCIESRIMSDDWRKNIYVNIGKLYKKTEKAKEILPSTYRIGETIFTYMAFIGGKLYSNHPKNMNHVHKDTKDLISVIIKVGKDISGGDTVFYYGVKNMTWGVELIY